MADPNIKEATVEKLRAEAKRAAAQAAEADAETARIMGDIERNKVMAAVLAEKGRQETENLRLNNEVGRMQVAQATRKEEEELASNRYHQVYAFGNDVSFTSVDHCITRLSQWHRNQPGCDIEIIFTSPGGDVIAGMQLFDYVQYLRNSGHHVTTVALGWAASMAGILLQAGDERVMGREAYILIHEVSASAIGKFGEMEDELKFVRKIQKRILDIFAARAKVSRSYLEQHWKRKDWWVDSEEALQLGLIDRTLTPGEEQPTKPEKKGVRGAKKAT